MFVRSSFFAAVCIKVPAPHSGYLNNNNNKNNNVGDDDDYDDDNHNNNNMILREELGSTVMTTGYPFPFAGRYQSRRRVYDVHKTQ